MMEHNRLAMKTSTIFNSLFPLSFTALLPKVGSSVLALSVTLAGGCSTFNHMDNLTTGADDMLTSKDIALYTAKQEEVYQALLRLASLPDPPATSEEWNQFIMAGVQYANQKCENYLDAVNWSKQGIQRENQLIGQSGSLVNGVLGIAKASARELALTAAAFGYTQAGFASFNADMLAGLEPSTTRNLVHNLQQQYVDQLGNSQYTNRVGAFNALQGYIRLCLPGNIAAEANNAVRTTKPVVKSANTTANQAPGVTLDSAANSSTMLETNPLPAPVTPPAP